MTETTTPPKTSYEDLASLLNEVRGCFTRDDDLPDELLPRIDAALESLP